MENKVCFELIYNRKDFRKAVNTFNNKCNKLWLVFIVLLIAILATYIYLVNYSNTLDAGILLSIFIIILICLYVYYYINPVNKVEMQFIAFGKFNCQFSEGNIIIKTEYSNSEYKWKIVKRVYIYKDLFIFTYIDSNRGITIPKNTLDSEQVKVLNNIILLQESNGVIKVKRYS